jgi:hypothetical protein
MRRLKLAPLGAFLATVLGTTLGLGLTPASARADEASVTVGPSDDRWASPPPGVWPGYGDPPPRPPPPPEDEPEAYRSPVRFGVGPAGFVAGHASGFGLGIETDFGTGVVGFRLAGSWMAPGAQVSLDQYTGELTLDALPHGPFHPLLGVGFGFAHTDFAGVGGGLGVGVGRLGLEYSLALRDADLRLGASVTGGLPGPRDATVPSSFGPYAVFGGTLSLGF